MKSYIGLMLSVLLMIHPTITGAEIKKFKIVSRNEDENITIYAKKMNDLFIDFK